MFLGIELLDSAVPEVAMEGGGNLHPFYYTIIPPEYDTGVMLASGKIGAAIAGVCQRDPDVRLVYLHGSHAWGMADSESDVDVALLADSSLDKKERFALRLQLMDKLAEALGVESEKMDVIIFQDVPVLLRYNAVFKGICVFERDRSERNLFLLKVEQEYDDEAYYIRRENEYTLQKILSSTP